MRGCKGRRGQETSASEMVPAPFSHARGVSLGKGCTAEDSNRAAHCILPAFRVPRNDDGVIAARCSRQQAEQEIYSCFMLSAIVRHAAAKMPWRRSSAAQTLARASERKIPNTDGPLPLIWAQTAPWLRRKSRICRARGRMGKITSSKMLKMLWESARTSPPESDA